MTPGHGVNQPRWRSWAASTNGLLGFVGCTIPRPRCEFEIKMFYAPLFPPVNLDPRSLSSLSMVKQTWISIKIKLSSCLEDLMVPRLQQ